MTAERLKEELDRWPLDYEQRNLFAELINNLDDIQTQSLLEILMEARVAVANCVDALDWEREAVVNIPPGLHVIKYIDTGVRADYPIATIRPASGFAQSVDVVSVPGATQGRLNRPGDVLIVRVREPSRLEIGVSRKVPTGTLEVTLRVEALASAFSASDKLAGSSNAAAPALPHLARRGPKIFLMAHVAMRGDVEAAEGEWVAGPMSPAPIEGMTLRSADPSRAAIEVQVWVARALQWSPWMPDGNFVGTRGRGLPLVAVRLRLVGADAGQFEIVVGAMFRDAPVVTKIGKQIELSSTAGFDPLVGLRLRLQAVSKPSINLQHESSRAVLAYDIKIVA